MTSPESTRRSYESVQARRTQLLQAAVRVMGRIGVAAASTRAITAEAGLPHGSFHYCFGTKEKLLEELFRLEVNDVATQLASHLPTSGTLRERLELTLRAELERVKRDPDRQHVMLDLSATAHSTPALAELPGWEHDRYLQIVRENLVSSAGSHDRRAERLAVLVVAGMRGIVAAWLARGPQHDDAEAEAERSIHDLALALALFEGEASADGS
ncbi:TetR family transcriptional regulator [Agreia pratensis]|uniref:TetR/AcrR family transcriptional regulator n=1 Tax=Agreia pratensis TaxID=150121 RepID=UPI001889E995|nr:TetR/AcrR family transcriptional regulator [Agreia pratensis]MBF4633846.1 TetR family transcriptional regulator [Agreia pratensis]